MILVSGDLRSLPKSWLKLANSTGHRGVKLLEILLNGWEVYIATLDPEEVRDYLSDRIHEEIAYGHTRENERLHALRLTNACTHSICNINGNRFVSSLKPIIEVNKGIVEEVKVFNGLVIVKIEVNTKTINSRTSALESYLARRNSGRLSNTYTTNLIEEYVDDYTCYCNTRKGPSFLE